MSKLAWFSSKFFFFLYSGKKGQYFSSIFIVFPFLFEMIVGLLATLKITTCMSK